jgi:hypothetical protein
MKIPNALQAEFTDASVIQIASEIPKVTLDNLYERRTEGLVLKS